MIEPRIQYVASADGTQIAYTTFGEGPPLVLPANAWGDIRMHTAQGSPLSLGMAVMAEHFSVTVYDGRGQGASDRNVTDLSLAARLADLEAVVDRLKLDPFALMGFIHGCSAAVAYAAKHRGRVSRMVLFGVYDRGLDYYNATPQMRAIRNLSEMAEDHWDFFTLTLTNWLTNFAQPDLAAKLAALYRENVDARDYVAFVAACEATDITDLLPLVSTPTLVIRDTASGFTSSPEFARRAAAAIPGAQAVTVNGPENVGGAAHAFLSGNESAVSRPSQASVMTVLFTDVVGHTEMMRRLGDARGRDVLREHETITRGILKTHGGTEVKTMGDGFMASFGSVTKAVECAVALQKAFDEHNSDTDSPLQVRCGLNAGEPIADDGDLFGSSVILASRIASKAQGGEILASMAVRELCSGKGFLFADLGDHELRGFEDPVRVFEVKWRE